jgi:hypothetical protein
LSVSIDDVICKAATGKAILVVIEGEEYWIPQSQVDDDSEVWEKDDEGTLVISDWIAEQKGIG